MQHTAAPESHQPFKAEVDFKTSETEIQPHLNKAAKPGPFQFVHKHGDKISANYKAITKST